MHYKSPLTYIITLLFITLFALNLYIATEQHFIFLARSFIHGRLDLVDFGDNISDTSYVNGKYYWPLGPFPAVLLIPFVMAFRHFFQGFISFPLSIINFYFLYKIARKLNVNHQKSLLMAIFFIFGSIYTPLAALPASWYFSQTLATTLIIAALYEFFSKKRFLLIGTLLAAAIATRFNLIFSSIFFAAYIFRNNASRVPNLLKLFTPIAISIILISTYNYARFNNPLESGYKLQLIPEEPFLRRNQGLFSIKHIPSNIYYMIFKGPEPVLNDKSHALKFPYLTFDSYGLSIFFLSPVLFVIFQADFKNRLNKYAALTILLLLIPIITYYGIGQKQIGFRYALDFFPFIFLLLIGPVKKLKMKLLYLLIFFGVFFSIFFTFNYLYGLFINSPIIQVN